MGWHEIRTQEDADAFLARFDTFHDWYVAGFTYDPLAFATDGGKDLARFVCETDRLALLLRWDCVNEIGEWPEVEIEFRHISEMGFSNNRYPDPMWEATLLDTERGWVFLDDKLYGEKLAQPWKVKAGTYVHAGSIRWRSCGCEWWGDGEAKLDVQEGRNA